MDRFDAMGLLLAAVDSGSLSAAARRTSIPLATVSRRISELEKRLNVRLLNRSSRRLALTEAGSRYVAACRRILDEVAEAERSASGEYSAPRGDLVVSAPLVFGRRHVLPVVSEFLAAYPEIDVKLALADRVISLLEEPLDAAIRIGELADSSLVALRLGSVRRLVCASPAYLARRGEPMRPADLAAHDCITFDWLMASDSWTFGRGRKARSVPIRSRLIVNAAEAAIDAAVAGSGITRVLSYQIAEPLRAGKLKVVLASFESEPVPVSLIHAGERLLPRKLRAFLDFTAPRLRERLIRGA